MVNKLWYVFANRPKHLGHPPESFNQLYKLLHFGFEPHPSLYLLERYYTVDRKRKNARVEGREDGIRSLNMNVNRKFDRILDSGKFLTLFRFRQSLIV